jgi:glycosyltransferase involved in cell wall biosynthesis
LFSATSAARGILACFGKLENMTSLGKLGFFFRMGHGHYAQFLNFQECVPPEDAARVRWMGFDGTTSGDWIARLPAVSKGLRLRRHEAWQVAQALRQETDWQALFFAGTQMRFLPFFKRFRCYMYTDFSPSCQRDLAPWYDDILKRRESGPFAFVKQRNTLLLYTHAAGVFSMSKWAANALRADYPVLADTTSDDKIHVTLPGANLKHWHFVDRADRSSSAPVRILMVGGEFARKGGNLLLEWAEQTTCRNWEMDIVTWPGQLPAWVQELLPTRPPTEPVNVSLAPRLPNVRVHLGIKANSPDSMALFANADVFCLPTLADGSSIASLEAMATGLPVLVGAVGGIPELIEDGVTGSLMRRGDVAQLADRLEALLADSSLRLTIGRAARRSCEDYFNVERQLRDILRVMDRSPENA